jgi:DNA-directed RNA polymerase specialized sigma24 family protein
MADIARRIRQSVSAVLRVQTVNEALRAAQNRYRQPRRPNQSSGEPVPAVNVTSAPVKLTPAQQRDAAAPAGEPVTPQQRAHQLREQGYTFAKIGRELGVSPSTARRWCQIGSSKGSEW